MCNWYKNGSCKNAHDCKFLHIDGDIKRVCRYYRAGLECKFGSDCIFRHSILSKREEECKHFADGKKCNRTNCKYKCEHICENKTNITDEERKMKQEENEKKNEKEVKHSENKVEIGKNEEKLELEQIIQVQLIKVLKQCGIMKE